jgi:Mrp family chromosome partitioning ATPase
MKWNRQLFNQAKSLDEIINHTQIPHLDVILSGPVPPNPSELIMSDGMSELIEELKRMIISFWIRHQWDWFLML